METTRRGPHSYSDVVNFSVFQIQMQLIDSFLGVQERKVEKNSLFPYQGIFRNLEQLLTGST